MTETPSPEAVAPPPGAGHGAEPARGITNVPRSSINTGKFGRMFRGLAPLVLDDAQIQNVVSVMVDAGDPSAPSGWSGSPTPSDAGIAAGWTYFAQFVDHDITFDPTSMLDRSNDPDALENFRTPRFDLDSVYGLGPTANPWLYDQNNPDKLLLGLNPDGFLPRDLNRNHQGRAILGDPRNDVHVIIAQLHLAFVEFHNHVVDRVRADPALVTGVPATPVGGWGGGAPTGDQPTFGQIVTLVRWHYQWLVLNGFLQAIVGDATLGQVLKRDKKGRLVTDLELYSVKRKPWMPVEFSGAAYRFGHSLVRSAYLLNGDGTIPVLPVFSAEGDANPFADLRGFRRLPAGWEIEWRRFFDGLPGSGTDTQRARRFDTQIASPLHSLPGSIDRMGRSLALLNLRRGVALELPSGEDLAAAVAAKLGLDPAMAQIQTGLPHPSPLWFWFLKEAELVGGQSLGPIGGRIVAEVLIGLAKNDPSSFLKAQPDWRPSLGPTPGEFTIGDLLGIAVVRL